MPFATNLNHSQRTPAVAYIATHSLECIQAPAPRNGVLCECGAEYLKTPGVKIRVNLVILLACLQRQECCPNGGGSVDGATRLLLASTGCRCIIKTSPFRVYDLMNCIEWAPFGRYVCVYGCCFLLLLLLTVARSSVYSDHPAGKPFSHGQFPSRKYVAQRLKRATC